MWRGNELALDSNNSNLRRRGDCRALLRPMKLKRNERCPIHRRRDCCGRAEIFTYVRKAHTKWEQVRPGVRRIRDEHADHPDGYRYKLSPAEMKKVLNQKIAKQSGQCAECGITFSDYSQVEPDHIKPKGMQGGRADDRESNIRALCHNCNFSKGSRRIPVEENSPSSDTTSDLTGPQVRGDSEG